MYRLFQMIMRMVYKGNVYFETTDRNLYQNCQLIYRNLFRPKTLYQLVTKYYF